MTRVVRAGVNIIDALSLLHGDLMPEPRLGGQSRWTDAEVDAAVAAAAEEDAREAERLRQEQDVRAVFRPRNTDTLGTARLFGPIRRL